MNQVRINKYLASAGVAARRKIDEMIEQGKVSVNGKKAVLGLKVDPEKDKITINGKPVSLEKEELEYIAIYKPRGVVSTVIDTHARKKVVDLVDTDKRLYPVGRLDFESEGLMFLTNDGNLANMMMHPRYHVPKTYEVKFLGGVSPTKVEAMRRGVRLTDGITAPAEVTILDAEGKGTLLKITLFEGRNRQIRRMAEKLRLHVLKLKRVAIGPIDLGDLESGGWRGLTPTEVQSLKTAASV
jgi:pseudouridine synthase